MSYRARKLSNQQRPSPTELEEKSWQGQASPVSDDTLVDFEQESVWDINIFSTPDGTLKVFTTRMFAGTALAGHIEELQDHFAAINHAESPLVWTEPIDNTRVQISFLLEGTVIGYDLTALEGAEELLRTYQPLTWDNAAYWQPARQDLSDPTANQ